MGLLASEMQLLAEHIGRYERQTGCGYTKTTFTVCVMVLADYCTVLDLCSTIDNGPIDAAILTNTDIGQDH